MQRISHFIIVALCMLTACISVAQQPTPALAGNRFPNIRSSLEDGFYSLAEQQARGVLLDDPNDNETHDATLLLAHALWGQKRFSELVFLLKDMGNAPEFAYWRARAHFDLQEYAAALKALEESDEDPLGTYEAITLRLKGRLQQLSGQLDEAKATYLRFAKEHPTHAEATSNQMDLADVYLAGQHVAEAKAVYEKLIQEGGDSAKQLAQLRLAHLLYTTGDGTDLSRARTLLAVLANNESVRLAYRIDACIDLAALEEMDGNFDASMSVLRQGISLAPDARIRVRLKLILALKLRDSGDIAGTLKLLEECRTEAPDERVAAELQLEKAATLLQAERFQEADEAYQIYLDVADDPAGLPLAYMGKGLALWGLARYAESATFFDKAEQALERPLEKANALIKAGDAYYQAERWEDAEKRYRAFVVDYPGNNNMPNVLYQLGLVLARIGRRTEALTTFDIVESSYPTSPFAEKSALRTADILRTGGQWEEALSTYDRIIGTYTNAATVAFSIQQQGVVLYQYLKRFSEAQTVFEKILADYPDSEHAPQAAYMRGFCLYAQGQIQKGIDTCKTFIEEFPKSEWTPDVIFWMAEHYFNLGSYAEAEPLFLRIASDFKDSSLAPRALYWAGRAAAAESDYVKAIERYSEVAKTYPASEILPQTRFAQGDALTELGDFPRAILAFEEVIKKYPESELVNAAWGRKGDCQFSLAVDNPARYEEAMASYQAILDRPAAEVALKMQAEYKIGRCREKTGATDRAFSRYMNVVYTFKTVERTPYSIMWFTRAAFGAAALKENEKAWIEAVQVYERVVEADVPAKDDARKRIDLIRKNNWLLFEQAEEASDVGSDG